MEADLEDIGGRWAAPVEGTEAVDWTGFEASERVLSIPKRLEGMSTNEFIASTETEARDGDIIEQKSWRLADYRRNPVVLDNHGYGRLVGRSEQVKIVGDQLHALIRWDDSEDNPLGRSVARLHREGWRRAVSVRWLTGKRTPRNELPEDHPHHSKGREVDGFFGPVHVVGDLLQRCTLLEISSVDVPGDAHALQTRFFGKRAAGDIPDPIARFDLAQALEEARADGSLIECAAFRSAVEEVLLTAARTDGEFRRALVAIASDIGPPTPDKAHTISDWLKSVNPTL